jgi:hypothetical protein
MRHGGTAGLARAYMITQGAALPFRVNDTAIVWRQFDFRRYFAHKGKGI